MHISPMPMPPCTIRYTGHTLAKFIITFAIGVITGCFAVALSKCVGIIMESKLEFIQGAMEAYEETETEAQNTPMAAFVGLLWFVLFGGIMVSIATSMVQYWAPASAGAGVTLVMVREFLFLEDISYLAS